MNSNQTLGLLIVILFAIYLVPIIWVLLSSRSHGGAKFGWLIIVLFFSWLGVAAFLIFTQAQKLDQSLIASSSGGDRVEPIIGDSDR